MKHCQNCIFKDRKKIPYEGDIPCDIMIVGEAPAETEELVGRPFVGDSGKILRGALRVTGLTKYRILIANALKCRVFKDVDKTKDINSAMKLCKNYLEEAIEKAKPKIIVCLGAYAIKQVLNKTKVLENRGKLFDSKYNIPVFCTIHPSYILRGGAQKKYPEIPYTKMSPREKMLIDDFMQVKKILENGRDSIKIDTSGYKEATIDDLKALLKYKRIAVDLETDGLGFGNDRKILSISFTPEKGKSYIVTEFNEEKTSIINRILSDNKIIKIVANRPFDELMWEIKTRVKWQGHIHDVLVLAHLIDENLPEGYNLESVVHNYTDLKNIKDMAEGLRKNIESMSKETLIKYNGVDTDGTFRAYNVLVKELRKDKKLCNYYKNFIMPILDMFAIITGYGFPIDIEELRKSKDELQSKADKLHEEALSKIPLVIKILHKDKGLKLSRANLIRDVLFTSKFGYKLKPKKFTGKTKQPATDEGHLKEFKDNEFVSLLLRWKKAAKILTTYYKQIKQAVNKDGKIYPSTLLYQTVTGRCLVGNSKILTDKGKINIRDIVKNKLLGLKVLTHKKRWMVITDAIYNGKKPVYKIRTKKGKTLIATANHPFWAPKGWVQLKDLTIGDNLYIIKNTEYSQEVSNG